MKKIVTVGLCFCGLLTPLLTGCNNAGTSSKMAPEEKDQFKGGPMPPEARQKMQEQMQRRGGGPGAGPPVGAGPGAPAGAPGGAPPGPGGGAGAPPGPGGATGR